ncbi:MAG: hypothetical protein ABEI07_02530 [Candidatus Nanohaloarchaea archaeon]
MEMEVVSREDKQLLGREEVELELDHTGESTPDRSSLRSKVAAEFDVDPEKIEIYGIYSSKGVSVSTAQVNIHEEPFHETLPEEGGEEDEEEETAEEESGEEGEQEEEETGEEEGETGEQEAGGEEDTGEEGGS